MPQAGTLYLPGLRHDEEYRSNVAVTAAADSALVATFLLHRGTSGLIAGGITRPVAAGEQRQWSLDQLFPGKARAGSLEEKPPGHSFALRHPSAPQSRPRRLSRRLFAGAPRARAFS